MAEELNQVQEKMKKAEDGIMAAEKSINEVVEKLKTADAIQAKELEVERDYLRAEKIALLQLLAGLQQKENRLAEAQDWSAAAGPGPGSTVVLADEADVQATIKARAPCSAKYAAHLLEPTSPQHKKAVTVVGQHHLATYAHEGHLTWEIGQKMQVAVHCTTADRRVFTDAEVVHKDSIADVVILKVQRDLAPPVLDCAISTGDMYYIHGQSTQAQADDTSISHGMVAATEMDTEGPIRGDIVAGAGDSGGGCFSVATGKLIAMVVGSQAQTKKAIMLPISAIAHILADISASEAPGAAA